jgi:hypothetical protein
MTAMNALEQALEAWNNANAHPDDREARIADARALAEWGIFSTRHIILITGLPSTLAYELLSKTSNEGGRFNPEALPFLLDLRQEWARDHEVNRRMLRLVANRGVSQRMISRLTEIPKSNIGRWLLETA